MLNAWHFPAFFLFLYFWFRHYHEKIRIPLPVDWWSISIVGLVTILAISTLLSPHGANWGYYLSFLFYFMFAQYVRYSYGTVITFRTILIFGVVAIFVQSSISIIQQLTLSQFGSITALIGENQEMMLKQLGSELNMGVGRIGGTLGFSNAVGNWIVVFFPFLLAYPRFAGNTSFSWIMQKTGIVLGIICLILTFSVGNLGIFFIVNGLFLMVYLRFVPRGRKPARRTILRLAILSLLFIVLLIAVIVNPETNETISKGLEYRISMKSADTMSVASGAFRLEMMITSWKYFKTNPFLGIGVYNSRLIYDLVETNIPDWWNIAPHNLYCMFAVDAGILGFLFYSILTIYPMVALFWVGLRRRDDISLVLGCALFAVFLFGQIYLTPILAQFGVLYMLMLGIAMGHLDYLRRRKKFRTDLPLRMEYSQNPEPCTKDEFH